MMQTRRKFLGDCSRLAAASCLVPTAVLAETPAAAMPGPDAPGFAQFVRQVNTVFTVRAGSVRASLRLLSARLLTSARSDSAAAGNERFSLRFQGPAQPLLPQDTYWFEHPHLGRLQMFIVPAGLPSANGGGYEAVFDRPVGTAALARQLALAPRRVQTI